MWITEFRKEYGLTLEQLGAAIRRVGARKNPPARVSDILLENLETKRGYKTVPGLADLIAETCGATPAKRDELVLERYRGTWRGTGKPKVGQRKPPTERPVAAAPTPPPTAVKKKRSNGHDRQVIAIDRNGNIVHRYGSVKNAWGMTGLNPSSIRKRCCGTIMGDEFRAYGYTFRYADAWEGLTEDQRKAELARAAARLSDRPEGNKQPVVAVDRGGNVRRFATLREASAMTGDSPPAISQQINRHRTRTVYSWRGFAYRKAEDWDGMTEEQRREFLEK